MRLLCIGDKTLKDMTQEELSDFMYKFGYCGSPEFWDKPIFTEFDYDEKHNSIFFNFYQIRFSDKLDKSRIGHINIKQLLIFLSDTNHENTNSYKFDINVINFLINNNYDIPFYNTKEIILENKLNELLK